jgi:hypothetical protein
MGDINHQIADIARRPTAGPDFYSSQLFDMQISSRPTRHGPRPNGRRSNSTVAAVAAGAGSSSTAAEVGLGHNSRTRRSHHRRRNRHRRPTRRYQHQ